MQHLQQALTAVVAPAVFAILAQQTGAHRDLHDSYLSSRNANLTLTLFFRFRYRAPRANTVLECHERQLVKEVTCVPFK